MPTLAYLYRTNPSHGPEPVFVNLLTSLGIDSHPGGPVWQPYLVVSARKAT